MAEPNSQNVKPFFQSLNDKKSNQLYSTTDKLDASNKNKHKGNTHYTDENGKKYSRGFTPPVAFISYPQDKDSKGLPKELGVEITNSFEPETTEDRIDYNKNNYSFFKDLPGWEFLHNVENEIYLSSFIETDVDNEDPISFGYDIIINYDHSPLFNGSVENFINTIGNTYVELGSRLDLIQKFKKQFFNFFKINSPISAGQNRTPKTYYLHKITGLDQLTEVLDGDKPKQFVDYGKDILTLTLNEDVSINTGYLASLYKTLAYSRVNGKKMIPDNLLRFDMEIVVTEMRKYNRTYRPNFSTSVNNDLGGKISVYADVMSKYRYRLYECQFIFDKFSHEGTLDMSDPSISKGFDIKINYKYYTLNFEKVLPVKSIDNKDGSITKKESFVNNARIKFLKDNVTGINVPDSTGEYDSKNTGGIINTNGKISIIELNPILNPIYSYQDYDAIAKPEKTYNNLQYSGEYSSAIDALDANAKSNRKSSLNKLLEKTKDNVISSANNSLQNAIYTINQELYAFVPTNFVGGFTEDGWQYNIPAYYTNKAINTTKNVLQKTLQTVRADIYAVAEKYKMQFLNNINVGINQGTNLLNNALGRIPGAIDKMLTGNSAGINTKSKQNNIYGNSSAKPIVYSGDYSALPDEGYQPTPNNSGFSRDGFQYNLPAWNKNNKLRVIGTIRNNNTSR
jgi:hypothetical protein